VIQALERNAWHVTRTAKELGLADHASLLKVMRRLGVQLRVGVQLEEFGLHKKGE